MTHTQCLLEKGSGRQVSWIPSSFAEKGRIIKLRTRGSDVWDDGWTVIETWARFESDEAAERSQDYKKHHEASDAYRDKDGHWVTPANR